AELGSAEDQRAARALAVLLDPDVLSRVDLRSTPRAVRQLVRRTDAADRTYPWLAAVGRLHGFVGIARPIGRRAAADPQADSERCLAPATVAIAEGRAANVLAGADERSRPLELLKRQEPQRVPHQHGDAVLPGAPFDRALQSP